MLNPQGEVFFGIVRKIKRKSMTHSGNPTYKIFLDNRTIDTSPTPRSTTSSPTSR